MRTAVLAVTSALLVACQAPPVAAPPVLPTPPPLAALTATATPQPQATIPPQPSPTAPPVALPGIRATPSRALPESFRYVALDRPFADGFRTRLWLVDLDARKQPAVVAEWDGPASPVGEHSISSDGRAVLVSAKGSRSRVALYLLRPETGTTTVLFEEPNVIVISPRISPDGQRFAFTRHPDGGDYDDGIWAGLTAGGEMRRIVDQPRSTSVPRMSLAWSADSVWLAFTSTRERTDLSLAHRDGGPPIEIGEGDRVSWRRNPPELLVAANGPPTSRIYTFDVTTRKAIEVATVDRRMYPLVQWHPTLERFVYVESEGAGREASGGIWLRSADGTGASSVDLGRSVFSPQWSRDGTLLTALGGGDEVIVPVIELFTGRRVAVLCRRGGTPPADCA